MIFLSVCSTALVFLTTVIIIHINILMSERTSVEITNAVSAPSAAVLGVHAAFVGSTLTDLNYILDMYKTH